MQMPGALTPTLNQQLFCSETQLILTVQADRRCTRILVDHAAQMLQVERNDSCIRPSLTE